MGPWDAKRVRTALWPSTEDWPDGDDLWPDVAISPPAVGRADLAPIRASDIEPKPGPLWITYWVWAVTTPFVKIGHAQYQADRDGRWRGTAELAQRRVSDWSTGCMWTVQLIRVQLGDAEHEGVEHALRAVARVTPEREWFDLRRL